MIKLPADRTSSGLLAIDQAGSVLGVSSTVVIYSCFGYSFTGRGQTTLLAFSKQPREPITDCYLLGNGRRAYNPVLMRFHSADTLSPFGEGGLNAYSYCENDPVNWQDGSGQIRQLVSQLITATSKYLSTSHSNPQKAKKTPRSILKPATNQENSLQQERHVTFNNTIQFGTEQSPQLSEIRDKIKKHTLTLGKAMDNYESKKTEDNVLEIGRNQIQLERLREDEQKAVAKAPIVVTFKIQNPDQET
ncbi:RHS repeat-associated core domain-containing protein [Pseudomonas sp. CCOS 191]|nr:RHS repeat-associated core domain-containing protein [Pseudomonas sp. CCOS 191]